MKESLVTLSGILFFIFSLTALSLTADLTTSIQPEALINHIRYLASEDLKGRYPGTPGSQKAVEYIKEKFKEYGLSPIPLPYMGVSLKSVPVYEQPFSITIRDLKTFHLNFKKKPLISLHRVEEKKFKKFTPSPHAGRVREGLNQADRIENDERFERPTLSSPIPLIFSPEGTYQLDPVFAGYGLITSGYDAYQGLTVQNKAVIILDEVPDFLRSYLRTRGTLPLLFEKIKTAQEHGAKALILYVEANLNVFAPYLLYPSRLPEPMAQEINKARKQENFISLEMEISKMLSSVKKPPFEVKIPVVLIPYYPADTPVWLDGKTTFSELKESLEQAFSSNGQDVTSSWKVDFLENWTLDLEIRYKTQEIKTTNVLGFLPGQDIQSCKGILLKCAYEVVILGGHYDHLGTNSEGKVFYGADDNASGIAALLEIAKALSNRKHELKRSALFIAFGAEEWGLLGSQFYVDHPVVPLDRVIAMLNLDSIGKGKPMEIHLVGSSVYPELASISRKYMAQLGLKEGPNLDHFAFEYGTDHYPFHLKGVPAMEYYASNFNELHTLQDTPARIQPDKVAQVAKVVFLTAFDLLTTGRN
ncbi:MAG TPA: M20/M25/M40 family metallo-hydrolase [Candidatus Limnocylindrales bacterium]|nr:M20/M25/M40 family metallo-hydrolase [Candidatus Limnocylindrales bacterium]